jgi:hypothetical protein
MDIGLHELTDILSEAIAKLDQWLLEKSQGDEGIQDVSKSIDMLEDVLIEEKLDRHSITIWTNIGVDNVSLGALKPVWIGAFGKVGAALMNFTILIETKGSRGFEAWITKDKKKEAIWRTILNS